MSQTKKVDVTQLYDRIRKAYRDRPEQRFQIEARLIDLAREIGVDLPYMDRRPMYLIADCDGKLCGSTHTWQQANRFCQENPRFKVFNRTHPACPPELKAEFDRLSGWTDE